MPLIVLVLTLVLPTNVQAQAEPEARNDHHVYIATISYEPYGCDYSLQERALESSFLDDSRQRRPSMTCNVTLSEVARQRAKDMAQRDYFGHTNPDGFGPNYLVKAAGYGLPGWYNQNINANNVESIGAGNPSADGLWQAWVDSAGHRDHVLGLNDFYGEQVEYGIGYYYDANATYKHYWVLITAIHED